MSAGEVAILLQGEEKEREDMHASSSYRMPRPLSHGLRYLLYPQTLKPALGLRNPLVRESRNGVVQYGGGQIMHG
jgi:hypothetical protein